MNESAELSLSEPHTQIRQSPILPWRWVSVFIAISASLILFSTWERRYDIFADGISYLDMARYLSQGDLTVLFHPYWSSLYPAAIAIGLKAFSGTRMSEIEIAHIVNGLFALVALASFTFFVKELFRLTSSQLTGGEQVNPRGRLALAYGLFLLGVLKMIGVGIVTPDLAVAAIVFLAAGLGCRLASHLGHFRTAVCLGLVLGLGYFAKAPMLPLGVLLLLLLGLPKIGPPVRRRYLALAGAVFALIVAPYIAILGQRQHKFTFGESGYLNYAWHVQQSVPRYFGWANPSQDAGVPTHPVHLLGSNPMVYEFAAPAPGTFPLWYDPSYFHQGLRLKFDARKLIMRLRFAPQKLGLAFGKFFLPLFAGIGILAILAGRRLLTLRLAAPWLAIWSVIAAFTYALLILEDRYIGPFLAILFMLAFDAVASVGPEKRQKLRNLTIIATAVCLFLPFLRYEFEDLHRAPSPENDGLLHMTVAQHLSELGLRPGDKIAVLGLPFDVYFAHLAQLRIAAYIGDEVENDDLESTEVLDDSYWALGAKDLGSLRRILAEHGIKAIVTSDRCDFAIDRGWLSLGTNRYCALLIDSLGRS